MKLAVSLLTLATLVAGPAVRAQPANPTERDKRLVETYRKMLAEDPGDEYPLRRLLEVSHAVGGVAGLVDLYRQQVDKKPKDYAAWLVLGHLHRAVDAVDEASTAYARAAKLKPKSPKPQLALAQLHRQARKLEEALSFYDKAIALTRDRTAKQDALKAAAETAIEDKDIERARAYFAALIKTEPRNIFLRMEQAAMLVRLDRNEEALEIWLDLKKRAKGKLKHLVLIWKELATLYEQQGDLEDAEKTWREALKRTPDGHWAKRDMLEGLIGVYRRKDGLRELIAEFEPKAKTSYTMLVTVALLYEELADDEKALELLRRAAKRKPTDSRVRMQIITLLERIGKPDEVITAYKQLVRASPGEARHELRLAELYFHAGRIKDGFALLTSMGRRYRDDPGVHQAIIDLTMRFGDRRRRGQIERSYKLLIRLEPREESHVISLGEYYWSEGKRAKALSTWKKLLNLGRSKGEGWFLLAEVYADHDMPREAVRAFQTALAKEPNNERFAKAYALLLERQREFAHAEDQWVRIIAKKGVRSATIREARRHIIELWDRKKRLDQELKRLEKRFAAKPPDIDAGHFLAAAYLSARTRQLDKARRVLEKLRKLQPGNLETLVGLEQVYTRENELAKAIDVLRELARVNSPNASEYMHRAADLALSLGDDRMALTYMRRVVELNPRDPKAHARVAGLHRRMGNLGQAARSWREALAIDPRNRAVQFKLAALYRDMGSLLREEQVLSEIVREARDPADSLRAGRRLLQVAAATERLEAAEGVLRPLVFNRRSKSVYLKLLVDLYALMGHRHAYGDASYEQREQALRSIGERALKPLLDALVDNDVALRARALDVLRLAHPPGAAMALARLAQTGDHLVQFQAAVALGRIGTGSAAASLERLARGGALEIRKVAVWGLGLIESMEAERVLLGLLTRESDWRIRQVVLLALGHRASATSAAAVEQHSPSQRDERKARLWALGRMRQPSSLELLTTTLSSSNPDEARMAAWALGRVGTPKARDTLMAALWGASKQAPIVIAAALIGAEGPAAERQVTHAYRALADYRSSRLSRDLSGLYAAGRPMRAPPAEAKASLQRLLPAVEKRLSVLFARRDRAEMARLLEGIVADTDGLGLSPLFPAGAELGGQVASLLEPHLPTLLMAARGDLGLELHALALTTLGRLAARAPEMLDGRELVGHAVAALSAQGEQVRVAAAAALAASAPRGDPAALAALLDAAVDPDLAEDVLLRAELARALGKVGGTKAEAVLEDLLRDTHAAVRLAAIEASPGASPRLLLVLIDLLEDPVPDVAVAAVRALGASRDPKARAAIQRLLGRSDPRLARAAREALSAKH